MERKSIEASIQRELVKWLKQTYPAIEIKYNKNENKRDKLQAILDKKMGQSIAGTPDLTLTTDFNEWTYILELELKKLKGTLNPAQIAWHLNFKPTKNRVAKIAYGYIEALEAIESWLSSLYVEKLQHNSELL